MVSFKVMLNPDLPKDRVYIVSTPDTIITTMTGNVTHVTIGTLTDMQARIPGISYDNPIAMLTYEGETTYFMVKPLAEMNEDERRLLEKGGLTIDLQTVTVLMGR